MASFSLFSIDSLNKLFNFGSKLLITGLYGPIISNLSDLLIGKLYSPTSLGLYIKAKNFVSPPIIVLTAVIERVSFLLLVQFKIMTKIL